MMTIRCIWVCPECTILTGDFVGEGMCENCEEAKVEPCVLVPFSTTEQDRADFFRALDEQDADAIRRLIGGPS